jgi:2,3-dihydroxyphenylpropionate 1,2-dioxygenase
MAETVYGAALSHSPLMFVPGVDGGAEGARYLDAVQVLRDEIAKVDADAVLIFFPDHFRAVHYANTPPFCLGVKYLGTWGDWFLPRLELRIDEELASHVLDRVLGEGFDLAYSVDMRIDHGGAQPLHVLALEDRPVVPVFVNCAAPPLPGLARCAALGAAVGRAVASFPGLRRVAVLGSGGLSHHVPLPGWQELTRDDGDRYRTFVTGLSEEELVEAEPRRVQRILDIIGTSETWTDEELDREVLAEFASGALSDVVARSTEELAARGGSGMNEIRTWVAAFAAAGASGAEILEYTPVVSWATGMGVVRFDAGGAW